MYYKCLNTKIGFLVILVHFLMCYNPFMLEYYLFLSSSPLDRKVFENIVISNYEGEVEVKYTSSLEGYLLADSSFYKDLDRCVARLHNELNADIAFLCVPKDDGFMRKELREAKELFPNSLHHLSDIILKQFSYGDFSAYPFLSGIFKKMDPVLLETAKAYLDNDLDASLASDHLYIHRNTFLYRIKAFVKASGVDIRVYHNALLLDIYLRMSQK